VSPPAVRVTSYANVNVDSDEEDRTSVVEIVCVGDIVFIVHDVPLNLITSYTHASGLAEAGTYRVMTETGKIGRMIVFKGEYDGKSRAPIITR